jgi:SAM-dependent methyltransferase
LGDVRAFSLPPGFDAALSTFDSLNHILSIGELRCAFANVFGALAAGGVFVFDLNMQESFETLWRGTFASVDETSAGITRGDYDPATKTGRAEVTLFRLEKGTWRRSDVTVLEHCYTPEEVTAGLQETGFADLEIHDAWELGMRGETAVGRAWFFARRPAAAR